MNSVQESTNELNAAIRYAENAIASANQTIELMKFRQDMAKTQYTEQTGREQALEEQNNHLHKEVTRLEDKNQGLYDDKAMLEKNVKYLRDENERLKRDVEFYTKEYNELVKQKEASSGPCGCQAYRDLERELGDLKERLKMETAAVERLRKDIPTMPVIPKAVAIAIFREGVAHGVSKASDELDNFDSIEIHDSECMGNFEVEYTQYVDLSDHIDLDWLRSEVGGNDEAEVIEALKNLCADSKFECRIHGVDDQEENKKINQ